MRQHENESRAVAPDLKLSSVRQHENESRAVASDLRLSSVRQHENESRAVAPDLKLSSVRNTRTSNSSKQPTGQTERTSSIDKPEQAISRELSGQQKQRTGRMWTNKQQQAADRTARRRGHPALASKSNPLRLSCRLLAAVACCCCFFVHIRRVHRCCCPSGSLLIACCRLPTLDVLPVCPVGCLLLLLVRPHSSPGSLVIACSRLRPLSSPSGCPVACCCYSFTSVVSIGFDTRPALY